jgi:hypothetical protein
MGGAGQRELRSASLDLGKRISGVEYNVEWPMLVVVQKETGCVVVSRPARAGRCFRP